MSWTGDLNPAATSATITYSVTIDNPDTGDLILADTVTSPAPGSNCPAAATDPRCTVTVTVVSAATLTITATAGAPSAVAGGVVSYTVTIANSGLSDYTGAAFTVPLGGGARITPPTATTRPRSSPAPPPRRAACPTPARTWAGPGTVPASGSVTLTYSVTVDNPGYRQPDPGQHRDLGGSTGSNCGDGSAPTRGAPPP